MMFDQSRRHAFPAFGTTVEMVIWSAEPDEAEELISAVETRAARWERIFSRFLPQSELNQVNNRSGQWASVSSEFVRVMSAAREGYIATGGRFDPAILSSLEYAGYDRPFVDIANSGDAGRPGLVRPVYACGGVLEIELDEVDSAVRLPVGLRIDLGGIAKGAFVDSIDDLVRGLRGVIVDAGGDLRVWGAPGPESVWRVGVQHPGHVDLDIAQLELESDSSIAVATSSTRTRTWCLAGERQNHLIDPVAGHPVPWSTPNVTVVADTVAGAEIQAKSILISISRGEVIPYTNADLVLVAYEDGRHETITPYAAVA